MTHFCMTSFKPSAHFSGPGTDNHASKQLGAKLGADPSR